MKFKKLKEYIEEFCLKSYEEYGVLWVLFETFLIIYR